MSECPDGREVRIGGGDGRGEDEDEDEVLFTKLHGSRLSGKPHLIPNEMWILNVVTLCKTGKVKRFLCRVMDA